MPQRKQIDLRGTSDKKQPDFEPKQKGKKVVEPKNLAYREWIKYKGKS